MLETIQAEQRKTNERLENLEDGVAKLEADVSVLKEDVDFVKGTVIRLENVHGKKIDVLFDRYMQLTQRADRTDEHDAEQDRLILTQLFPNAME